MRNSSEILSAGTTGYTDVAHIQLPSNLVDGTGEIKAYPICGLGFDSVKLISSICHPEGYFYGNVQLVNAPSSNTGGVVITDCASDDTLSCYQLG